MPSYKRPGVYVEESLNQSNAVLAPTSGTAAFLLAHSRGPTTPTLVTSWNEFLLAFGGFGLATEYLPFALHQFFSNGGRRAWVQRIIGTSAVKATRTLSDRAGTPVSTLRVDAINEGAWGNSIYIDITDSGTDRFNIVVRYGGTGDQYVVERWLDLSMTDNDGRYAPTLINAPVGGSSFINVADLASATAAPADRPSASTGLVLSSGADGSAPTTTQQTNAISNFDVVEGPLTMAMPGVFDTTVLTSLLGYAAGRGDAFCVIDTQSGRTVAQATSFSGGLASAYGACYYPWIYVGDPSSSAQGALKLVPPSGAVVGQYARVDTLRGTHKAPAGVDTRIAGAIAVETKLTATNLEDLNTGLVNAIRQLPGVGIAIFGARTLLGTSSDRYVPVRRTLNYLKKALSDGTRWAVFEPNDQVLWSALRQRIEQFLLQQWQRGALRGGTAREAFYVKCDADNNPSNEIAAGVVHIEVGLALQYPAEFVVIRIGQWEGGSTAQVLV